MKLREVKEILDADVIVGDEKLDIEVTTAFGADLMSDVLSFAKAGCLLLTGLTNTQVVRIANVLDMAAIILVRGKKPPAETISMAKCLSNSHFNDKIHFIRNGGPSLRKRHSRLSGKSLIPVVNKPENTFNKYSFNIEWR